ncbi:hypothetical protein H5410_021381 [Solanum commersonii]|uniref:Uncharacterized protein n=1 Tax=Solanum commersonii TaxID=4109 RepID=A0A9J5ZEZ4_SOLCO|nr:hypothetical protein H5410_021381 [Solanum commersonii]
MLCFTHCSPPLLLGCDCTRAEGLSETASLPPRGSGKDVDDIDSPETSIIPLSTTGDVQRVDTSADDSKPETDEERIEVYDDEVYNDLADLENAMDKTVARRI